MPDSEDELSERLRRKQARLRTEAREIRSRRVEMSLGEKASFVSIRLLPPLVIGGLAGAVLTPAFPQHVYWIAAFVLVTVSGVSLDLVTDWLGDRSKRERRTSKTTGLLVSMHQSPAGSGTSSPMWALGGKIEFDVDGETYTTRFSPRGATNSEAVLARWYDRYPLGMEMAVYYEPEDPSNAGTERPGATPKSLVVLQIGAVLIGYCLVSGARVG